MGRNVLINKDVTLSEIRREKAKIKTEWSYFEAVLHTRRKMSKFICNF